MNKTNTLYILKLISGGIVFEALHQVISFANTENICLKGETINMVIKYKKAGISSCQITHVIL